MIRAHRIRLNPTAEQDQYFWRCCGVARFTMKQRRKGRHRNVYEVFWQIGNRKYLVQEWNYNRVVQRLAWLESQPEVVKRRGFRQIQR